MSSLTTRPLVSRTATRPASVLVIDHCHADRQRMCRQLRMIYGPLLRIREADAACQGFELLEQAAFDLVFVEYQLPDADGLEVISRILEGADRAAIILMTSQANDRLAAEAMRQGASDYLVKGDIGPAELEQTITFALRTARLEDRNSRFVHQLCTAQQRTAEFLGDLSGQLEAQLVLIERLLRSLKQGADHSTVGHELSGFRAEVLRTQRSLSDLLALTNGDEQ